MNHESVTPTEDFAGLLTEARNPDTVSIDRMSTVDMLRTINAQDRGVIDAVAAEIPELARAIDAIVARLEAGGRLFYMGAGTSGRLGVLDASECPPTYNVPPDLVQGLIAGGDVALRRSVERAEDDPAQGARDLMERGFSQQDALVGIAASGRTPYVLGAIDHARSLGALTIGLSCVPHSELARRAEIDITPATGPEVITGSTRMKAGTATKLVLNMISTATMIRLGYVYGNLMINVQPTNDKLADRAARIIASITGLAKDDATQLLATAGSVKTAVVMHTRGVSRAVAEERLAAAHGQLAQAIEGHHGDGVAEVD